MIICLISHLLITALISHKDHVYKLNICYYNDDRVPKRFDPPKQAKSKNNQKKMADFGGSQFSNVPKQLLNGDGGAFPASLGKRFDRGGRGGRGGHHGRGGQHVQHHGQGGHMPMHNGPMTSIAFAGHIVSNILLYKLNCVFTHDYIHREVQKVLAV